MDDALSLQNFEDLLDPDLLDKSKAFFETGKLKSIRNAGESSWSAKVKIDGEDKIVYAQLDRKHNIISGSCTCGNCSPDDWEIEPCLHLMALYFAIKLSGDESKATKSTTKTAKTVKKAAVPAKEPKKPKDPAERLLGELSPAEIYEFVRLLVTKNKDFRSQFMLHFSEKDSGNDKKFDEIILNAIQAVKGRKKYIKAAEGSKIATALAPLLKQAATAESKGYFRESFAACRAMLKHLPSVFTALENHSAKMSSLFTSTTELIEQIIKNTNTPFEFRDEVFKALSEEFVGIEKEYGGDMKESYYKLMLESGKITGKIAKIADILSEILLEYQKTGNKSPWTEAYYAEVSLIRRLYDLYDNELKDEDKALSVLEKNKKIPQFHFDYIKKIAAKGEHKKAVANIEEMLRIPKHSSIYSGNFEEALNKMLIEEYQHLGEKSKIVDLGSKLFKESRYLNFTVYELVKANSSTKEWGKFVENSLAATVKIPSNDWDTIHPYLEILLREQDWERFSTRLLKSMNLNIWINYGIHVYKQQQEKYFAHSSDIYFNELKIPYINNAKLKNFITHLSKLEGGIPALRKILSKTISTFTGKTDIIKFLEKTIGKD